MDPSSAYSPYPAQPLAPPPPPQRSGGRGWVIALVILALLVLVSCAGMVLLFALAGDGGAMEESVAVIHLEGAIGGGRGTPGEATPEQIISQIRRAENDINVKSILLRIDSPGGTVAASEEIAMDVRRAKKPVVASIGDLGASGAYMVAMECDEIVAAPSSAVGSIGVIQQFPNIAELAKKLGVKLTVLHAGRYKDAGSPFRDLTPEERRMFQKSIDEVYDRFVGEVARARKLPENKARSLATGWVWSGIEAKELGLVDTIGNYSDALLVAGKRGGIEGPPPTVDYESEGFGALLRLLGAATRITPIGAANDAAGTSVPQAR